jgi:hypothetical protein
MANNLTRLMPALFDALDTVSREAVGVIPAASRSAKADTVSIGQTLKVPVAKPRGTQDISPGKEPTGSGDDFDDVEVKIERMQAADPIWWNGDEESSQMQSGMLEAEKRDQITQAMRALANKIETDLALEGVIAGIGEGNVYGVAGTPPFSGSLSDMANVRRIMNEMGTPSTERQFVANSVAAANLLSLNNLTHAEKAGGDTELRTGIIRPIMGFNIWESGGLLPIAAGTANGYLVNGAAAVGAKQINIDSGSGIFKRGNIISFAGNAAKYVVAEDVPNGGTVLKIAGGLNSAVADNTAIALETVTYLPSLAFHRNALLLVCRPPKLPKDGDKALDVKNIVDPVSGLAFQAALYGDYMQNRLEIRSAWGWRAISPRHILTLFG